MTLTAITFVDSDLVDIRRFCGYPLYGTGTIVFQWPRIVGIYQDLEIWLQNCTANEGVIVQNFLTQLRILEAAIPGTGANLDTASAAVWVHNKHEMRDRLALYDEWRLRLCEFLGVVPGPSLSKGRGGMAMVV